MSVTTGARIGAYEVLAPIGRGGMGEVYRARDTRLKRDVALKIVPESDACDVGMAERGEHFGFTLEACQAVRIVRKPSIGCPASHASALKPSSLSQVLDLLLLAIERHQSPDSRRYRNGY